MNFLKLIFFLSWMLPLSQSNWLAAQTEPERNLLLHLGVQHFTMLDRQATPVLYEAWGPQLSIGYNQRTQKGLLTFGLNGGLLKFQPNDPELQFIVTSLSGISAGLNASYLHSILEVNKSEFLVGAALKQEVILDFDGIGNFPWIFGQGGIFVKGRWNYSLNEKNQFSATLALPVFSWITDMPYNQIPRVPGKEPGVGSVISEGSRIASWNSYQRVDVELMYRFDFHEKWSLSSRYQWAWFHDSQPLDLWAYQGTFSVGILRRW